MDAAALITYARAAKQVGLELAELSDAWRIFPRAFCTGYGYLCWEMWQWVASKPDVSAAQSVIVAAVIGLCVPLLGLYFNSGRKWAENTSVTVQMPHPTMQPVNYDMQGQQPSNGLQPAYYRQYGPFPSRPAQTTGGALS